MSLLTALPPVRGTEKGRGSLQACEVAVQAADGEAVPRMPHNRASRAPHARACGTPVPPADTGREPTPPARAASNSRRAGRLSALHPRPAPTAPSALPPPTASITSPVPSARSPAPAAPPPALAPADAGPGPRAAPRAHAGHAMDWVLRRVGGLWPGPRARPAKRKREDGATDGSERVTRPRAAAGPPEAGPGPKDAQLEPSQLGQLGQRNRQADQADAETSAMRTPRPGRDLRRGVAPALETGAWGVGRASALTYGLVADSAGHSPIRPLHSRHLSRALHGPRNELARPRFCALPAGLAQQVSNCGSGGEPS